MLRCAFIALILPLKQALNEGRDITNGALRYTGINSEGMIVELQPKRRNSIMDDINYLEDSIVIGKIHALWLPWNYDTF